jgi:hypothetical protein
MNSKPPRPKQEFQQPLDKREIARGIRMRLGKQVSFKSRHRTVGLFERKAQKLALRGARRVTKTMIRQHRRAEGDRGRA